MGCLNFSLRRVAGKREILDQIDHAASAAKKRDKIAHPGTYNANPLSAAAAVAALSLVRDEDLAEKANKTAANFLSRVRKEVRRKVAGWTGEYQYTIDQVLESMISRCRELNLRLAVPEDQAKLDFTILLTVQTMNYLHSGRHRVAL